MSFSDRELYGPIGGYPDAKKANGKSSPDAPTYNATETGAVREGLGIPYTRHIPLEAVAAAAASLEHGAQKYSDRNWEKGLPWQQMIDSLKRHIEIGRAHV